MASALLVSKRSPTIHSVVSTLVDSCWCWMNRWKFNHSKIIGKTVDWIIGPGGHLLTWAGIHRFGSKNLATNWPKIRYQGSLEGLRKVSYKVSSELALALPFAATVWGFCPSVIVGSSTLGSHLVYHIGHDWCRILLFNSQHKLSQGIMPPKKAGATAPPRGVLSMSCEKDFAFAASKGQFSKFNR